MVMTMNKDILKIELSSRTNYSESEIEIIDEIIGEHFIVGRKNKEKMIVDFKEKLNLDDKTADELYNTCMSIICNKIKNKLIHPFKNND